MNGQWLGTYNGTSSGNIIINIDEMPSYFEGVAYLITDPTSLFGTFASFRTENKDNNFRFRTLEILPINPHTGIPDTWENVQKFYPNDTEVPSFADVEGTWNHEILSISWVTNIGGTGNCSLRRSNADQPSQLVPRNYNWTEYKAHINSLEGRRYLFRGQRKPLQLRTSFHRAGRANLVRFVNNDIKSLHRHLSARTKHVFNLSIPDENGAFYNLIQHHGYPTPLLDWTYSPYVAAFFAYRGICREEAKNAAAADKVRILILDQTQWKDDHKPVLNLAHANLFMTIGEFIAIENERMIPQQAASIVTNVDDIELFIKSKESHEKTYLSAIDLPVRDRNKVIQELRYMGITAGSMFPGLDGACEELKELNFEI